MAKWPAIAVAAATVAFTSPALAQQAQSATSKNVVVTENQKANATAEVVRIYGDRVPDDPGSYSVIDAKTIADVQANYCVDKSRVFVAGFSWGADMTHALACCRGNQIKGIALERERAFLAVLSDAERETLIGLLKRLHENLPAVETATASYVAQRFPKAARSRARTEEMRSSLLAAVSHDLRTPLAAITGAASSLHSIAELGDDEFERNAALGAAMSYDEALDYTLYEFRVGLVVFFVLSGYLLYRPLLTHRLAAPRETRIRTREPRGPTQAPTGSTPWACDSTAILAR